MLAIIGGTVLVLAAAAHLYVRLRMRPPEDLDGFYHEFEDEHPAYRRYVRWLQLTFGAVSLGTLLLFLAGIM